MEEKDTGRDSFVAEDARLQSLEKRLQAAQRTEAIRSGKHKQSGSGMNVASRAVGELIGGPVGGAIVGWLFDRLLGTYPWFLLFMMFLGFVVAVVNVYRLTSKPAAQQPAGEEETGSERG